MGQLTPWRHRLAGGLCATLLLGWAAHAQTAFTYDTLGRLATARYPNGMVVTYSYDAAGNRTQQVVASNRGPTANADLIEALVNSAVTIDPRANDTDPDLDPLTITSKTDGAHGTVSINSGASITYTPTANYTGSDTFTYTISDPSGATATGSVSASMSGTPDVTPNALAWNDISTVAACTCKSTTNTQVVTGINTPVTLVLNYTSAGNSFLEYIQNGATYFALISGKTVTVSQGDTIAFVLLSGGTDHGTITILNQSNGNAVLDTINYYVSNTTTNHPPSAVADSFTTSVNTAYTFDPRANDSDPDGDPITITAKTNSSHGTVEINGASSITYTPAANYTGSDNFTYTISDLAGATSTATASVTIPVSDGTVLFNSAAAGSFSYTVPGGVSYVDIEGWGGGANGTLISGLNVGGGGGGYFKKHIAVTQGQVVAGNIAAGGGTANTTVTSPALIAYTAPAPTLQNGGVGGNAVGGDINTAGHNCCQVDIYDGGGAGNGGGNQTTANANGTTPGGGGAGSAGLSANGRVTITARSN